MWRRHATAIILAAAAAGAASERAEPTAHFIERDRPELERRREDADGDGVRAVPARRCVSKLRNRIIQVGPR